MVINDIYPIYLLCSTMFYILNYIILHYTATLHYTIILYRLHSNRQYVLADGIHHPISVALSYVMATLKVSAVADA